MLQLPPQTLSSLHPSSGEASRKEVRRNLMLSLQLLWRVGLWSRKSSRPSLLSSVQEAAIGRPGLRATHEFRTERFSAQRRGNRHTLPRAMQCPPRLHVIFKRLVTAMVAGNPFANPGSHVLMSFRKLESTDSFVVAKLGSFCPKSQQARYDEATLSGICVSLVNSVLGDTRT